MPIVVDASAINALLLNESRATAVATHLDRAEEQGESLHAPMLAQFEVASALTKALADGRLTRAVLDDVLATLAILPVQYHNLSDLMASTIDIARSLGSRKAYDPSYIALAVHLQAELWTTDDALGRNAAGYGLNVVTFVEPEGTP